MKLIKKKTQDVFIKLLEHVLFWFLKNKTFQTLNLAIWCRCLPDSGTSI